MSIRSIVHLIADESGQDLVEYALLTGVVSVSSLLFVLVMTLLLRFEYVFYQFAAHAVWEPCAPGACP